MIFITVSTGIGGGIIINDELYARRVGRRRRNRPHRRQRRRSDVRRRPRRLPRGVRLGHGDRGARAGDDRGGRPDPHRAAGRARSAGLGEDRVPRRPAGRGRSDGDHRVGGPLPGHRAGEPDQHLQPAGDRHRRRLCRTWARRFWAPPSKTARARAFAQSFMDVRIVEGELGERAGALGAIAVARDAVARGTRLARAAATRSAPISSRRPIYSLRAPSTARLVAVRDRLDRRRRFPDRLRLRRRSSPTKTPTNTPTADIDARHQHAHRRQHPHPRRPRHPRPPRRPSRMRAHSASSVAQGGTIVVRVEPAGSAASASASFRGARLPADRRRRRPVGRDRRRRQRGSRSDTIDGHAASTTTAT